jgi:putative DNA primase/helicase
MIDVPVQGDHGAFDNLHECKSGRQFSEYIASHVAKHYGHAGPAFVQALINENPVLDEHLSAALAKFDHGDNPVQARAARTLAILAVAGELARHYGIVPWPENAALEACIALFDRWKDQLKATGAETPEAKICSMELSFISRHAESRFSNANGGGPDEPKTYNRAGWWEIAPGGQRIYLLPTETLRDACTGFDVREVARALDAAGALWAKDAGRLKKRKRTPDGLNDEYYFVNPEALSK